MKRTQLKRKALTLSVIIVTKDRPRKLLRAVAHILANRVLPSKLHIIDSSSRKNNVPYESIIKALCRKNCLPLIYSNIEHRGIAYARNYGLTKLNTDLFAFIDDDEMIPLNWVENCVSKFVRDTSLVALCGPKISAEPGNYWHSVWDNLSKNGQSYEGPVSFISSGNSAYRVNFIKKKKIFFDERMAGNASEDSVFSLKLINANARIMFYKDFFVYHDQRAHIQTFLKQWFSYGKGTYHYQKLYQTENTKNPLKKFFYRLKGMEYAFHFNFIPYNLNRFLFGNFIKDISFISGFIYAWLTKKE